MNDTTAKTGNPAPGGKRKARTLDRGATPVLPPPPPGTAPGKWRTRKRTWSDSRFTDAQVELSAARPYIQNPKVELRK